MENVTSARFHLSASTAASALNDKCRIFDEVKTCSPVLPAYTMMRKRDGLVPEVEKILIV
jgi:hypothetical protein